jgi:hypothetical protein
VTRGVRTYAMRAIARYLITIVRTYAMRAIARYLITISSLPHTTPLKTPVPQSDLNSATKHTFVITLVTFCFVLYCDKTRNDDYVTNQIIFIV